MGLIVGRNEITKWKIEFKTMNTSFPRTKKAWIKSRDADIWRFKGQRHTTSSSEEFDLVNRL